MTDVELIQSDLEELKAAMEGKDKDRVGRSLRALEASSYRIAEILYGSNDSIP